MGWEGWEKDTIKRGRYTRIFLKSEGSQEKKVSSVSSKFLIKKEQGVFSHVQFENSFPNSREVVVILLLIGSCLSCSSPNQPV